MVFVDKKTRSVYNSSNQLRIILIVYGIRLHVPVVAVKMFARVDGGHQRVYNICINIFSNFRRSRTCRGDLCKPCRRGAHNFMFIS